MNRNGITLIILAFLTVVGGFLISKIPSRSQSVLAKTEVSPATFSVPGESACDTFWRFQKYFELFQNYKDIGGIPGVEELLKTAVDATGKLAFGSLYKRMEAKQSLCNSADDVDSSVIEEITSFMFQFNQDIYEDPIIRNTYLKAIKVEMNEAINSKDLRSLGAIVEKALKQPWHVGLDELDVTEEQWKKLAPS